jgi:glutamine amidotransferase
MSVAVVRIGVGNTASVIYALARLGAAAILTADAAIIADADRVILPGVGAAAFAMARLGEAGLIDTLRDYSRPLLGLCLGQQLLFARSEEGAVQGLGVIEGEVRRLEAARERPIPHMGWSRLDKTRDDPLLDGVSSGDYCYFVHSYACPVGDATLATAEYGGSFAAIVRQRNFYGCQFHPERSGETGRRILSNFLALPC